MSLHAATSNRIEKFGGLYGSEQEVHETTKLLKSLRQDMHELKDHSQDILKENLSPSQYHRVVSFQRNEPHASENIPSSFQNTPALLNKTEQKRDTTLTTSLVEEDRKEIISEQLNSEKNMVRSDQSTVDVSSSPKYPSAIQFSTIPNDETVSEDEKAVLIVGGTDGSGTRRVVQILTELGVSMVSEDPETYDIHADLVGGWPTIVKPVIKQMRSLEYDPSSFSASNPKEYKKSSDDLRRLLNQVDRDSHKPTSYRLAVGGVLPKPKDVEAKRVKYGFKAPVSMALLPYWVHLLPHSKFVHVLRDGRDIAFSVNQGPVEKFYDDMYGRDKVQPPVKAIKLWSDWNSQIFRWSKQYIESKTKAPMDGASNSRLTSLLRGGLESDSEKKSFSYIVVHTEDTVSESRAIRFAAIHHLAKFVGSTISNDQICCMAVESMEFMGSHDRSEVDRNNQQKQVSSRYGKWKKKTEKNPSLLKSLYSAGNTGLALFGYDPMRVLPEDAMVTEDGYHCNFDPKDCKYENKMLNPEDGAFNRKPEEYAIEGTCEITAGIDYKGGECGYNYVLSFMKLINHCSILLDDLESVQFDVEDPTACCR